MAIATLEVPRIMTPSITACPPYEGNLSAISCHQSISLQVNFSFFQRVCGDYVAAYSLENYAIG
jgi:hypothetical protein